MTKNAIKIFNAILDYQKKYKNLPRILYLAKIFKITQKDIEGYLFELNKYGFIEIKNNNYKVLKEKIPDPPPTEIKKIEELPKKIAIIDNTDNIEFSKENKEFKTIKQLNNEYGQLDKNTFINKLENLFKFIKNTSSFIFNKTKNIFFKLIILFPVIVGLYISIDFTKIWFEEIYEKLQRAFLVSLFIVVGGFISYQLYKYYKQKKIKNKKDKLVNNPKRFIFLSLWLIIITFSITTGINGQLKLEYLKKIDKNDNHVIDNNILEQNKNYKENINDLNIDLKSKRKKREFFEIEMYKNAINKNDNTADRITKKDNIKSIKKDLKKIDKDIENLKDKINENKKLIDKQLESGKKVNIIKQIDFFTWLENIFTFTIPFLKWHIKIKADVFKFVFYLFLAILADIIPPLFFSEFLFIKEE